MQSEQSETKIHISLMLSAGTSTLHGSDWHHWSHMAASVLWHRLWLGHVTSWKCHLVMLVRKESFQIETGSHPTSSQNKSKWRKPFHYYDWWEMKSTFRCRWNLQSHEVLFTSEGKSEPQIACVWSRTHTTIRVYSSQGDYHPVNVVTTSL